MEFAAEPHHLEMEKQMKLQKPAEKRHKQFLCDNSSTKHLLNSEGNVALILSSAARYPGERANVYLSG